MPHRRFGDNRPKPNYPAAILYGSMATLAVVAGVWLVRLV